MGILTTKTAQTSGFGPWIPVQSGAIEAITFALTDNIGGTGTLRLRFKTKPQGKPTMLSNVYEYYAVPESSFLGIIDSDMPAIYMQNNIKDKFAYKRLSKEELEAESRPPPPQVVRPQREMFDESIIETLFRDIEDDDTFASARGSVRTGQVGLNTQPEEESTIGYDDAKIVTEFKHTLQSGNPFRYRDLTFYMSENSVPGTNVRVITIERTDINSNVLAAVITKELSSEARAIKFALSKLDRYLKTNCLNFDHDSVEQFMNSGSVVKNGYEYFIRRMTMNRTGGDLAYVIERRPQMDRQISGVRTKTHVDSRPVQVHQDDSQILAGIAFTKGSDAQSYLCSSTMFDILAMESRDENNMVNDPFARKNVEYAGNLLPFKREGDVLHVARNLADSLGINATVMTGYTAMSSLGNDNTLSSAVVNDLLQDDILIIQKLNEQNPIPPIVQSPVYMMNIKKLGWDIIRQEPHVIQFRYVGQIQTMPTRPGPELGFDIEFLDDDDTFTV